MPQRPDAAGNWGIVQMLAVLCAIALLPVAALLAWSIHGSFRLEKAAAEERVSEVAVALAARTQRFVDDTRAVLRGLAARPRVRALDPGRCDPALVELLALMPTYADFLTFDAQGRVVCSAAAGAGGAQPDLVGQAARSGDIALSEPMLGERTHGWVVVSHYPVEDAAGRGTGSVSASFHLTAFATDRLAEALPPGVMLGIVSEGGLVIARHPEDGRTGAVAGAVGRRIAQLRHGSFLETGIDGMERLYGFVPIPGTAWFAVAGVSTNEVFADARANRDRALIAFFTMLAVTLLAVTLIGRRLLDPVSHLAAAVSEVAGGDWSRRVSPAGPREIAAVAAGFNRMLDVLDEVHRREARLLRLYAALSETNQAIVRATDRDTLFRTICRVCCEHGGMSLTYIALVEDGRYVPVASHGPIDLLMGGMDTRIGGDTPDQRGPLWQAVATARPCIVRDYPNDSLTAPWQERAARIGTASCGMFPLLRDGRPIGVLAVHSTEKDYFDPRLTSLLEEMAVDIAFALDNLEREHRRIEAELALRESEARYRGLLERLPDAVLIFQSRRLVYTNGAGLKLFGAASFDDLRGRHVTELVAPEQLERLPEPRGQMDAGVTDLPIEEQRYRRLDGGIVPVEVSAVVRREGGVDYVEAVVRDIGERRRTEADLRRFRAAMDASSDAVFLHEADTKRCVDVNEAACRMLGRGREELLSLDSLMYTRKADGGERTAADRDRDFENALTSSVERPDWLVYVSSDGRTIPAELRRSSLVVDGRTYVITSARDISERKRAEAEREELLERLQLQLERNPMLCTLLDAEFRFTYVNPAHERVLGYGIEELRGRTPMEVTAQAGRAEFLRDALERLRDGGDAPGMISENRRRDGGTRMIEWSNTALRRADGAFLGILGMGADITDRLEAERRLRESEERFRIVARATNDGIWDWNLATGRVWWSDGFYAMFGYEREALEREADAWLSRIHPEDVERVRSAVLDTLGSDRSDWVGEYRFRRADGSWADVADHGFAIRDESGRVVRMVGGMTDITEKKRVERQLVQLAHYDSLTGLPNRVLFYERLRHALLQASRQDWQVGVLMLDLDRFKVVNDTLGHSAGDELLCAVSRRLADAVRKGDTVARLGGDEFAVVLPDLPGPEPAATVAQKLIDSLDAPVPLSGREMFVSITAGISVYPGDGDVVEELMRNADTALYRAKNAGRAVYQFFAPEMNASAARLLELESRLHHALDRDEFELHYQPKAEVATGRVTGAEALIRWRTAEGLVSPAEFVPLLEDTGLIVPVGDWVLRGACRQIRDWSARGIGLPVVSVNVAARQFQRGEIVGAVRRALGETGIDPGRLELEITESSLLTDVEGAMRHLGELEELGVRVAIDDFGTGYSSLAYLKRLRVDALKIDRSFVHELNIDRDDAAIVAAVIAMARRLGMEVVAEGVETVEQLAALRAAGCDQYQGYLMSAPKPAEELERWIVAHVAPGSAPPP